MKNTDNIEKMLTPQCEFKASAKLKDRVLEAAAQSEPQQIRSAPKVHKINFRRWATSCAAAAAVIAAVVIFKPGTTPMYAATDFFHAAIEYFTGHPSFIAAIKVRTEPQENFSYINMCRRFVEHTMAVEPQTERWALDKSGRKAVNDGQYIWQWIPDNGYGWKDEITNIGAISDFALLLNPTQLLAYEESIAAASKGAVLKKAEDENTITLVVTSPPQGKYVDRVGLNSSIIESDTRREYTFDKSTGRLLEMEIYAKAYGITRKIVQMTSIDYNTSVPQYLFDVPEGIRWTDNTRQGILRAAEDLPIAEFSGLSADETVKKMFAAMNEWDEDQLKVVLRGVDLAAISKAYKGCTLVECDSAFKSGTYAGVFVTCKVKLANGKETKLNVAMRNDNPWNIWTLDGGI